ncbi:MAG: HAD family hydrolase [Rhodobacteraceae bacterium]|nr:HAD family hydrolase [Paracoccaceae bacterium]
MRIATWSGPRNLSTAMMYAFAARGDCAVWDEPFYAAYLARTGLNHPMRDEIIAAGEVDAAKVAARLTGPVPGGKPHFYQKHMCQHMLPGMPRGWMREVTNVFLIRHPARVLASFAAKYENPTLADIGFVQQAELFDDVAQATGEAPIVIDSGDIRASPEGMMQKLCAALGICFAPRMLRWPAGGHAQDGVWAPVWYGAVHRSTGFAGPEGALPDLSPDYARLADQALTHYQRLATYRLMP